MDILNMSKNILGRLETKYGKQTVDNSYDTIQLKKLYNLHRENNDYCHTISIDEIEITTPEFKPYIESKSKSDILNIPEFVQKYHFITKIIYSCLYLNVEIFDGIKDRIVLKNNREIIHSLQLAKKDIITRIVKVLRYKYKHVEQLFDTEYTEFYHKSVSQIKLIDNIIKHIRTVIGTGVIRDTDNLITLVVPYFYRYLKFIEEYL